MFGNRYQAIFRSRWRALFWASGVLLTAYCTVPSEDGSDATLEAAGAAVAMIADQQHEEAEQHHANPWALDPDKQH